MPEFEVPCGHTKCNALANLAAEYYAAMSEDPGVQELIGLSDDIRDVHDAIFALVDHIATGLLRETLREIIIKEWNYGHSN